MIFLYARRVRSHFVRPFHELHQPSLARQLAGLGDEACDQLIERLMQFFVPLKEFFFVHQFPPTVSASPNVQGPHIPVAGTMGLVPQT